ncbi:MAG: transposase [Candidatus Pacebacteria bacterium]|nr:transposase [Candidatus Paceibacterota bacterium]
MERKFNFSEGEYYHVYNRGNNKSNIFLDNRDKDRFILLLYICNNSSFAVVKDLPKSPLGWSLGKIKRDETIVDIGAYCLMSNHFHILLHEKKEGGITKFVSKFSTGYSMYFNKRNQRTGSLFEGRFKAEHVDNDEYLKYLFAYIHLNPISLIEPEWKEVGITNISSVKKYLSSYKYSSYADYLGEEREEKLILDKEKFPEYFEDFTEFENFIDEWINYKS